MDQKQNITMIMRVNSRLDELHRFLNVKLPYLEIENDKQKYRKKISVGDWNDKIILPLWFIG
jgi:hypothetical protein